MQADQATGAALEVDVSLAYAAAEERAVRLTKALILADASVLQWRDSYHRLVGEYHEIRRENEQLRARVRELGGEGDAAEDAEDTDAASEAHTTQPFSD